MTQAWNRIGLGECGELYCGQSLTAAEVNLDGRGYPYFTGPEQWDGKKLHVDKWTEHPKRLVPEGCIFITVKGAGVGTIFPGSAGTIGRDIYAFRVNQQLDFKYVLYALRLTVDSVVSQAKGDIPGLSKNHILEHKIVLPGIGQQRRIVAKIEELFSELDNGVEALTVVREQLTSYRQAVLKHAFAGSLTTGWRAHHLETIRTAEQYLTSIRSAKAARFADAMRAWEARGRRGSKPTTPICDTSPGPSDFSELPPLPQGWAYIPFSAVTYSIRNGISNKPNETGALRIFRISAVRPMEFDMSDFRRTADNPEFASYRLQRGDIVFTRYNGSRSYVGVAALFRSDEQFVYPDKLIRCDVQSPLIDAGYVEKAVNCGQSRAFIEGRIRTTAGQSGISGSDLKAMPVPICPIEEQKRINEIVEAQFLGIVRVEKEIEFGLAQAEALRQAILKRAFAGQLVAQDPKEEPAAALLERIRAQRGGDTTKGDERGRKNGKKRHDNDYRSHRF